MFLMILEILYFVKKYINGEDAKLSFEKIESLAETMKVSSKKNVYLYRYFVHGIQKFDRDKLSEVSKEYYERFNDSLPDYFVKQLIENKQKKFCTKSVQNFFINQSFLIFLLFLFLEVLHYKV